MNDRPRGTFVFPLPAASGPLDSYALCIAANGASMMVHSEGVGYPVTDEKPWTWNDYQVGCESFTPAALAALALNAPAVDLADWVREFGARLESNFHQIRRWAGPTD